MVDAVEQVRVHDWICLYRAAAGKEFQLVQRQKVNGRVCLWIGRGHPCNTKPDLGK